MAFTTSSCFHTLDTYTTSYILSTCPFIFIPSYARSQPARKDATSQNLLRQSFIAYSGAREEERGREEERERGREREREAESRGREQRKRRRERDKEREMKKRGSARTPFLLRRIILHLGHVTPWLAAAHWPSCHHEKGRAHGGKTAPAHVQIIYCLEHSCQRHLVMANVSAAPHRKYFIFSLPCQCFQQ